MTNWVVLKVEKKKKSEDFQFQINYYSNYNYYLDNIVYAAYLKQLSSHTELEVFSKICFVVLEKVSRKSF